MTIPVSTVDTVKDFLVANIKTQINDTSVLVCYDEPGPNQPDDIVAIGDIAQTTEMHAYVGSGGQHWLIETYHVTVTVSVYRGGDDPSVPWKRAKVLSDAIDTLVRTDPTLGAAVTVAWPAASSFVSAVTTNHAGRTTTVTKTISVEAEI